CDLIIIRRLSGRFLIHAGASSRRPNVQPVAGRCKSSHSAKFAIAFGLELTVYRKTLASPIRSNRVWHLFEVTPQRNARRRRTRLWGTVLLPASHVADGQRR